MAEIDFKLVKESQIVESLGLTPRGETMQYVAVTGARYMDDFVPMDTGTLKRLKTIEGTTVTYNAPYAHYMYEGKVMGPNIPKFDDAGNIDGWWSPKGQAKEYTGEDLTYTKPGTGAHWDELMMTAVGDRFLADIQRYLDKGGKA